MAYWQPAVAQSRWGGEGGGIRPQGRNSDPILVAGDLNTDPDAHFDHAFARGLDVRSVSAPADYDHCSDHRPVVIGVVLNAQKTTGK